MRAAAATSGSPSGTRTRPPSLLCPSYPSPFTSQRPPQLLGEQHAQRLRREHRPLLHSRAVPRLACEVRHKRPWGALQLVQPAKAFGQPRCGTCLLAQAPRDSLTIAPSTRSHRTHHSNHGHVENDESWHPTTKVRASPLPSLALVVLSGARLGPAPLVGPHLPHLQTSKRFTLRSLSLTSSRGGTAWAASPSRSPSWCAS